MENNWYKIFPLQILSHVARIPDATMHGDFLLVAMCCLQQGGLPNDDGEISWITRLSPERVAQLRPYLNRLADVADGKLMIRFVGEIIQEREEYAERRANAGRQGGRPPKPDPIDPQDFPPTGPKDRAEEEKSGFQPQPIENIDLEHKAEESNEKRCFSDESNVYQFEALKSQYIHTDIQDNKSPSGKRPRRSGEKSPDSTRAPNPHLAYFQQKYQALYGMPYAHARKDFVQLAHLLKTCAAVQPEPWALTDERWRKGADNYFASALGQHTMADLCVRFAAFFRSPLDRFGKPTAQSNAVANGGIEPKRGVVV